MTASRRFVSPALLLPLFLAPLALGTTGCAVSTGSKLTFSGKSIEDGVLRRLSPGESKEFVLTLFGPPSTKDSLGRDTEVWVWTYHEWSSVQSPLLGVGPKERVSDGAVNVEFKGRTVVRVWRS